MSTIHSLKCLPEYFDATADGRKNFEVRINDRYFKVGDILKLERWSQTKGYGAGYVGTGEDRQKIESLRRRITYILTGDQFGIEPGYVVLGLTNEGESE